MPQTEHIDYQSQPPPLRTISIFWPLAFLLTIPLLILFLYGLAVAPEGPGTASLDNIWSGNTVLDGFSEAIVFIVALSLAITWLVLLFRLIAKLRHPIKPPPSAR